MPTRESQNNSSVMQDTKKLAALRAAPFIGLRHNNLLAFAMLTILDVGRFYMGSANRASSA
jgi:hypothetical protein